MRQTERKYQRDYAGDAVGPDFTETTTGDAPSSVEVSINAKGQAQCSLKLYYADPATMQANMASDILRAFYEVRKSLDALGIVMAGEANGSGK